MAAGISVRRTRKASTATPTASEKAISFVMRSAGDDVAGEDREHDDGCRRDHRRGNLP